MKKKALITGVTGQDGSFLSEFLLEKGYEVHGVIRRSSVDFRERISHLEGNADFHLHYADLSDSMSVMQVMGKVRPDEVYNLAAQSHVQVSFDSPEYTADIDAVGVLRLVRPARQLPFLPGLHLRTLWQSGGSSPKRTDPFPSLFALRRSQALWILDRKGISRGIRHLRLLGHPLQP